jgi:hypothetical protein
MSETQVGQGAKAGGMTAELEGQRVYLAGLPFAAKDAAKEELGAKWDADRRQWWVGRVKLAAAVAFAERVNAQPAAAPAAEDVSKCRAYAQVMYKGRRYYVVAETADVTRCRLTTLDGLAPFWVDCAACELVKRYEGTPRGWEGGRFGRREIVYPTIGSLRDFRDRQKAEEAKGTPACAACGKRGHLVHDLEDGLMSW